MFSPLVSADDDDTNTANDTLSSSTRASQQNSAYIQLNESSSSPTNNLSTHTAAGSNNNHNHNHNNHPLSMMLDEPVNLRKDGRQISSTGLELSSLRSSRSTSSSNNNNNNNDTVDIDLNSPSHSLHSHLVRSPISAAGLNTDSGNAGGTNLHLLPSHHPSSSSSSDSTNSTPSFFSFFPSSLTFELLSLRLKNLMLEDSSETAEEELEMVDYDNAEDAVLERKFDEDGIGSGVSSSYSCTQACSSCLSYIGISRLQYKKLKLTFLRMIITIIIGLCIGLTGFAVSRSVASMIHGNLNILNGLMNRDRPAAAFFSLLLISCFYTGIAVLFVTFGSWQTRGSGVGRLNAYLSGMSSSKFLSFKTLLVKIGGLILTVAAGIKQGMEGPFIHIGAMVGLHVSRFIIWLLNCIGYRWGILKYTQLISGVVDERMFISSGAAAGFSVAFNAPIAGVLYVQDGAYAYWSGEYTIRTFLCTMVAVTTINMCWKDNNVLPSRGLIDIGNFLPTTITLQEFWGFIVLGIIGGLMGILFTKANVLVERFRQKYLQKMRLPNVLDVLACTIITILLSFILPFLLQCHNRYDDWCILNPDRCIQFHCGPGRYSDLATFFFTMPEETIRILFDRTPTVEAEIPYDVLLVFCIFYTILACFSYGMAVPGGLFIPSIIIGASYGRLVGLAVQHVLPYSDSSLLPSGSSGNSTTGGGSGSGTGTNNVFLGINPGVYAVLGSASMLGGITRMTLPITVMMIEITTDSQFLIPIMLVVLLAKLIADFGCGSLYAEHLKLDGLIMVFGDRPPTKLKKLLAKDIMSRSTDLKSLNVIDSVEAAWRLLNTTKHNAFPVTDSSLATLRSIIVKRKQAAAQAQAQAQAQNGGGSGVKKRLVKRDSNEETKHDSSSTSSSTLSISTVGTGTFLGLIQRRHLIYVLTSMPCFASAQQARDSEPMTALPYEMVLSSGGQQRNNGADATSASSSSSAPREGDQQRKSSSASSINADGSLDVTSPSSSSALPPQHKHSVSHAMIHSRDHASGGGATAVLNEEGASVSASFVEWIARQSRGVGENLSAIASGEETKSRDTRTLQTPVAAAASIRAPSPRVMVKSGSTTALGGNGGSGGNGVGEDSLSIPILPQSSSSSSSSHEHLTSSSTPPPHHHTRSHSESTHPLIPGQDLTIQPELLSHYINLSPFIDQGAYVVNEGISARRVWALFRSLGMRHIVVLNYLHQPVGVITRRDLIRFAVNQ